MLRDDDESSVAASSSFVGRRGIAVSRTRRRAVKIWRALLEAVQAEAV